MKDFTPSCMHDGSNNNFAMYRFLMPYHMTDFDLTCITTVYFSVTNPLYQYQPNYI